MTNASSHLSNEDLAARAFTQLLTESGRSRVVCGSRDRAALVFDAVQGLLERAGLKDKLLVYHGFRELRIGDSTVRIVGSLDR